ncbi:hypothetical protein IX51_07590 [uncultured archaeon]|nr:hypothetical protein IX51_07590 [uncultured archaeon]
MTVKGQLQPLADPNDVARENYTIFTAVTLAYTGFSTSFPFIAVFLLQVKGVPVTQVGIIYLASGVLGIAGQIVGGRLSDVLGTKTLTVIGLSVSTVFYALLALFVVEDSPVFLYMISYPVLSLFNNLSQLALSSHVSDRQKGQMASGMSLLYVGVNLGFTIGPVSGGFLIAYYGYSSIFVFGAVVTLVSAVVALMKIKINPKYALRFKDDKRPGKFSLGLERGLFPFFVLIFISWLAIGYQAIPLSVFESQFLSLSSVKIGIVLTTNGLLITVLQVPISRAMGIERRMRLFPIALGSVLMAAGFVAIGRADGLIPLLIAITLTTLGEIMVAVPTQVVATLFSREHNRGRYQGFYFAFSRAGISLSSYIGPLLFGLLISRAFLGWYVIAAVSLISALGYYALSPVIEKEYNTINSGADIQGPSRK